MRLPYLFHCNQGYLGYLEMVGMDVPVLEEDGQLHYDGNVRASVRR